MSGTWTAFEEAPLTRESFAALLENRIPAVRIRAFATAEECAAFARAARGGEIKHYSVSPPVAYIGMAQYEYRWDRPKADYFRDVVIANAKLKPVLDASFDPVARLIERVSQVYDAPIGVGCEPGLGEYYAGIVRIASQGIKLHADFAPFNSPAYSNAAIDAQLGWNFFAESLDIGGETTVYNAPWTPAIVPGEIPQSYDLPRESVAYARSFRYAPTAGDVVIFNARNPHEVAGGPAGQSTDRIGIGSFMGRMPDRSLVLWS